MEGNGAHQDQIFIESKIETRHTFPKTKQNKITYLGNCWLLQLEILDPKYSTLKFPDKVTGRRSGVGHVELYWAGAAVTNAESESPSPSPGSRPLTGDHAATPGFPPHCPDIAALGR